MIPLVDYDARARAARASSSRAIAERGGLARGRDYTVGTMIELPRACVVADEIARHADFFSLRHQRPHPDGARLLARRRRGPILPRYVDEKIIDALPVPDDRSRGRRRVRAMAVERGRAARPDLELGVCGEHGGDPDSIRFFARVGLDYVCCSPFRVPIARVAAAQAATGSAERHSNSVPGGRGLPTPRPLAAPGRGVRTAGPQRGCRAPATSPQRVDPDAARPRPADAAAALPAAETGDLAHALRLRQHVSRARGRPGPLPPRAGQSGVDQLKTLTHCTYIVADDGGVQVPTMHGQPPTERSKIDGTRRSRRRPTRAGTLPWVAVLCPRRRSSRRSRSASRSRRRRENSSDSSRPAYPRSRAPAPRSGHAGRSRRSSAAARTTAPRAHRSPPAVPAPPRGFGEHPERRQEPCPVGSAIEASIVPPAGTTPGPTAADAVELGEL